MAEMDEVPKAEDDLWRAIDHHSTLDVAEAKRLAPILIGHLRQLGYTVAAPSSLPDVGELLDDEADFAELHRLYNFADDDSRQFTRWQMLVAIRHGKRLATDGSEDER